VKKILPHPYQGYRIMKVEHMSEYFAFERSDVKPLLLSHPTTKGFLESDGGTIADKLMFLANRF